MLDMSRMKHNAGPGSRGLDDLWSPLWSALSLVTLLVPVVQLGCPHFVQQVTHIECMGFSQNIAKALDFVVPSAQIQIGSIARNGK